MTKGAPWTEREIAVLRSVIAAGQHPREAAAHIADRSANACQQMAAILGIHPTRQTVTVAPRPHDDEINRALLIKRASRRFAEDGARILGVRL